MSRLPAGSLAGKLQTRPVQSLGAGDGDATGAGLGVSSAASVGAGCRLGVGVGNGLDVEAVGGAGVGPGVRSVEVVGAEGLAEAVGGAGVGLEIGDEVGGPVGVTGELPQAASVRTSTRAAVIRQRSMRCAGSMRSGVGRAYGLARQAIR